jgi:hypothetical protein
MRREPIPRRVQALLSRREAEGWSFPDLSRRTGLPSWKLRRWADRVPVPSRSGKRSSFVAVEVVGHAPAGPSLELTTPAGFRLTVPPGFDPDHLRRLLAALEGGC